MSAPHTQCPPLYLWGDLLGSSAKARRFRGLLEGLLDTHPMLEARHFVPEGVSSGSEAATPGRRRLRLNSGLRDFEVATDADESELRLIQQVIEGIVPEGSAVLAMAGPEEDPSDAIRADIPEHGEIILVDPDYQGDGFALADILAARSAKKQADMRRSPTDVVLTAPVLGPSGYAADGRAIFLALDSDPALRVHLRPLRYGAIQSEEDEVFLQRVAAATRREVGTDYVAIHLMLPAHFAPDPAARSNILRTTYECDRLPAGWARHIDQADEIWVPCGQNRQSFHRSGIALHKLRVVPEAIDSEAFARVPASTPAPPTTGAMQRLPGRSDDVPAATRFLSMFDWSERKAPRTLLRAFGRAFGPGEATLQLKVHSSGGQSLSQIQAQALEWLQAGALEAGHACPRLSWIEGHVAPSRMPALYAGADAFVLASRGEGWGRPVHEAMAMGLPVLTTQFGGTQDLCGAPSVAWNIPGRMRPCPPHAVQENPALEGLSWFEPDEDALVHRLREIHESPDEARARGKRARRHVLSRFHELRIAHLMRAAIQQVTGTPGSPADGSRGRDEPVSIPGPRDRPLLVELEGPLFEASSYAGIHRHLARALRRDPTVAVQLRPTAENRSAIPPDLAVLLRRSERRPDVCIRAGWPVLPHPPDADRWIQRVDWEYGAPPRDLASLLAHGPDEIWVHSHHVERGLVDAGIPAQRIWRLPHGIDPAILHPERTPLPELQALPPKCDFLFVGGPIWRKGADLLLQAWLDAFRADDPVRLVLRLPGLSGSYAGQGLAETFRKAARHPGVAEILILDRDLDDAGMGQLYAGVDALVHPYRGEGFGMPMLEAMACGLPVLATEGGAADDFLDQGTWLRIPAGRIQVELDEDCLGHPWALAPDPRELREALVAFPDRAQALRRQARERAPAIARAFAWTHIAERVLERLRSVRGAELLGSGGTPSYSSVSSRSPAATA